MSVVANKYVEPVIIYYDNFLTNNNNIEELFKDIDIANSYKDILQKLFDGRLHDLKSQEQIKEIEKLSGDIEILQNKYNSTLDEVKVIREKSVSSDDNDKNILENYIIELQTELEQKKAELEKVVKELKDKCTKDLKTILNSLNTYQKTDISNYTKYQQPTLPQLPISDGDQKRIEAVRNLKKRYTDTERDTDTNTANTVTNFVDKSVNAGIENMQKIQNEKHDIGGRISGKRTNTKKYLKNKNKKNILKNTKNTKTHRKITLYKEK